jgi:hypothetical protein
MIFLKEDSFPQPVSLAGLPKGECTYQVEVRCDWPKGLVKIGTDYRKLVLSLARGVKQCENWQRTAHYIKQNKTITTELSRKCVRVKYVAIGEREKKSSKKALQIYGKLHNFFILFLFSEATVCLFVAIFFKNLSPRHLLGPGLCWLVWKYNDQCVANTKDNYKWRVLPDPKWPTRLPQLPSVNCTSFIQIFACMHISYT